jgi:organic radical activating enzyme
MTSEDREVVNKGRRWLMAYLEREDRSSENRLSKDNKAAIFRVIADIYRERMQENTDFFGEVKSFVSDARSTEEKNDLLEYLTHDYVSGVTFSGGDPLFINNRDGVLELCKEIKNLIPNTNIWIYTGFTIETIEKIFPEILEYVDVLVDGPFVQALADVQYHWAGSTNQRVIKLGGRHN